jgi:hypothetical protein
VGSALANLDTVRFSKVCSSCRDSLPVAYFRRRGRAKLCAWCEYDSPRLRAERRWVDIRRRNRKHPDTLAISKEDFVSWYASQPDQCSYCGLTRTEKKTLRVLNRSGRCYVSWDIDRLQPGAMGGKYEQGNLALACWCCNYWKSDRYTPDQARVEGQARRRVWDAQLALFNRRRPPRRVAP